MEAAPSTCLPRRRTESRASNDQRTDYGGTDSVAQHGTPWAHRLTANGFPNGDTATHRERQRKSECGLLLAYVAMGACTNLKLRASALVTIQNCEPTLSAARRNAAEQKQSELRLRFRREPNKVICSNESKQNNVNSAVTALAPPPRHCHTAPQ